MTSYGTQSHYSDKRFAAIDGNIGDFPPLYSDLPFSRRRKFSHNNNNDAIKWAMRCVLASPILVLCLWTMGAFVFANKHVSSTNTSAQLVNQRQAKMPSPNLQPMMMMPPLNAQLPPQQPLQQSLQQQPMAMAMMQAPSRQLSDHQLQQAQAQPVLMVQSADARHAPVQEVPPLPTKEQALENTYQQTMEAQPAVEGSRGKIIKNQRPGHYRNQPRNPAQSILEQQQFIQPPQQPRQQILYYEPSDALANGKLEAPMTVYDLDGNPIPLQHLRGSTIFMEPPSRLEPHTEVRTKPLQMAISTEEIQKWGESTAQDQSIIVATVAVMALLVGAISARRMRSRNILSSCIENEALEDDVAYDTAYTTTNKDNSYYNTFASGGWKGDLEKFDV